MNKKKFFSRLFGRDVLPAEPDYFAIVYAELLFRITDLKEKNSSCAQCKTDLHKFKLTLEKLKQQG